MRTFTSLIAVLAVLLFLPACGGKKAREAGTAQPDVVQGTGVTAERPTDTEIAEDDIEVMDEGVGVGDDAAISERPLSDMTLEEINEAEFLRNIYFDFDMFNLRDDALAQLAENAKWLKDNLSVRVIIEGHCDERGTEEYNLALGEKRAKAARDYMVRVGIASHRMMIVSYGEARPVDYGHSEIAWAKNRRAHFKVVER